MSEEAKCPKCGGELGKARQMIVAGEKPGVPTSLAVCRKCNREWLLRNERVAKERVRGWGAK